MRERLLKKGAISESEVQEHLASLPDRSDDALEIGIKQPALQTEAEREVIVVRTLARPAQPVPPPRMFGDDDEIYTEEKPVRAAASRAAELDDLDDDDDDDLDDDEDDEDEDELAEGAEKVEKAKVEPAKIEPAEGEAGEPAEAGEAVKKDVDDDWA
ncbi:MAG TPA: hypothetical protein VGP93_12500 [Polyangiaceae bacterium]|nr:hypothetical protein [Polyangiaceae bacterium]